MYKEIKYLSAGDSAIVMEFGDTIKEKNISKFKKRKNRWGFGYFANL